MISWRHSGATAVARSASRIDAIFGMKTSPPRIIPKQRSTNSQPSSSVSQNRVMRGSVIGITPDFRFSRNSGTTLPREPMTLP